MLCTIFFTSYSSSGSFFLPPLNLPNLRKFRSIMHKYRGSAIAALLCLFLVFLSLFGDGNGMGIEEQQDEEKKTSALERMLSRIFHVLSTSFPAPSTGSGYWDKAKTLINRVQARFFPPNLDFRGSEKAEAIGGANGGKVKNAVAKSFGKSKATVEDSAKSAAKLAGETVHRTTEKLKKTFSESDHENKANNQFHRADDQSDEL